MQPFLPQGGNPGEQTAPKELDVKESRIRSCSQGSVILHQKPSREDSQNLKRSSSEGGI